MGEKFKDLFEETDSSLNYSLLNFRREENIENIPELILLIQSFKQAAKNILKDEDLTEKFGQLIEKLEKSPIKFTPPETVAVIIKK